jgi:hypothetical protein
MAAAAVSRLFSGAEGVEGNAHASRAWKGNDQRSLCAPVSLFLAQSKQIALRHSLFALR